MNSLDCSANDVVQVVWKGRCIAAFRVSGSATVQWFSPSDAAEFRKIGLARLDDAVDLEIPAGRLTHRWRAVRRRRMAMAVLSGRSVTDIAIDYGVSEQTVRLACRENGVTLAPNRRSLRL